ncbi:MAG: hypothetical protein AAGA62_15370, partial [Bacteroidota bacterium]
HFRNLEDIASLEAEDYRLFVQKKRTVFRHTERTLMRLFNEDQMAILHAQQVERRVAMSTRIKELQAEGKTKEEIELLLLEMSY